MMLGLLIFNILILNIADEVYDDGYSLLFRYGNKELRVDLKDIIDINYNGITYGQRVGIYIKSKDLMYKELFFYLPSRWDIYAKDPVIEELMKRIEGLKNKKMRKL